MDKVLHQVLILCLVIISQVKLKVRLRMMILKMMMN